MGKLYGRNQGIILDTHLVVVFIPFLQTSHDGYGFCRGRLVHHHHLEPPFESLVRLEIFLVFVQSSRTDSPQLTTSQCRLQDVGCIHRPGCPAGPDKRMDLIYEQYDLPVAVHDLFHDTFQPFLELSLIFRTRNQSAEIERIYFL